MSEAKRGCGYRKIGGRYLMGGKVGRPCGRFPFPLTVCPVCAGGIKQTRTFLWIRPAQLFANLGPCALRASDTCGGCPVADVARLANADGKAGLLWVGEGFYKTPEDFLLEAAQQGVCRRVAQVPKGMQPGQWVFLAHPKAVAVPVADLSVEERADLPEDTQFVYRPGVFSAFQVSHIDACVSEAEYADTEAMDKLRARGLTPVALPDLPRHRGSVYDVGGEDGAEAATLDLFPHEDHPAGPPDGATLN